MATYVPNATQTTEPLESRTVESAALEFRTLKTSITARVDALQAEVDAEEANRAAGDANLAVTDANLDVRVVALENAVIASNVPGAVFIDSFVATAAQTVFALTVVPITIALVDVYLNGVYQLHSSFAVVGNLVTLDEAVPAGFLVEVKYAIPV